MTWCKTPNSSARDAPVAWDMYLLWLRITFRPILGICVERYLKGTDISLLDKIKVSILELDAIKVGTGLLLHGWTCNISLKVSNVTKHGYCRRFAIVAISTLGWWPIWQMYFSNTDIWISLICNCRILLLWDGIQTSATFSSPAMLTA